MATKGSTTKVATPTVKLSSVKVPNAAKAVKPLVASKMAKFSNKSQKAFNPASGFKVAKSNFGSSGKASGGFSSGY